MDSETNKLQDRPDPETLLNLAKEAELVRGKLKIFLGYAAGVGKTFAMLEAARRLKADGKDVAIAYVETHKRVETEALLAGIEILPRKMVEYKGTYIQEMDLDAVLKRCPQIAFVDELAHTNAPNSRHFKRYQDVEEILAAGIDVYTTFNIQHLESLNDVIAQITSVVMKETVPDRILDEATEIEVVDIPISELLQRLKEGKVYLADQAARAAHNFFNEGNLNALREITLRRAAQRIDTQVQSYIKRRAISGPWPVSDRLLVCVTSHPASEELVRAGRLLAAGLDAQWSVIYVETSKVLSEVNRDRVLRTLQMAEQLGATTVTLSGHNIAQEIINYARRNNVTKIILGKPLKRNLFNLFKGTVVDQVIAQSGDIDIHVITPKKIAKPKFEYTPDIVPKPIIRYFKSILLVVGVSLFGWAIHARLAPTNLVMFYLLAVVIAAIRWGRGPSTLAALLSVLVFDFFFVSPYFTFVVSDAQYVLTFAGLFIVGLIISSLTAQTRDQAIDARIRGAQATALYNLSRNLTSAKDIPAIIDTISTHVYQTFQSPVATFLKEGTDLKLQANPGYPITENEKAVAAWVFQNRQPAGWGTDTLPSANGHYVPLKTLNDIFGVLGVKFNLKSERLPLDERRLLETFATQIALALERVLLVEESRQAQILRETEKLQNALFSSISHDSRTPLVSITGSLSSLMNAPESRDRKDLLENAFEQATRMNRLVANLLDMAKVEAGAIKLSPRLTDVQELISAALEQFRDELSQRKVEVDVPADLPSIKVDVSLMLKVLVNVLDNAIKYSPFNLPIDIKARVARNTLEIIIMDRGLGIPEQDLKQIFNKFYRVQRPENFEGTGLGLSICQAIVEAHKGSIWAENRQGGGSIFIIALPLQIKNE